MSINGSGPVDICTKRQGEVCFILTSIKSPVKQSKYSQRITEVANRSTAVGAVKGTLSGPYFDKLIHVYRLK